MTKRLPAIQMKLGDKIFSTKKSITDFVRFKLSNIPDGIIDAIHPEFQFINESIE